MKTLKLISEANFKTTRVGVLIYHGFRIPMNAKSMPETSSINPPTPNAGVSVGWMGSPPVYSPLVEFEEDAPPDEADVSNEGTVVADEIVCRALKAVSPVAVLVVAVAWPSVVVVVVAAAVAVAVPEKTESVAEDTFLSSLALRLAIAFASRCPISTVGAANIGLPQERKTTPARSIDHCMSGVLNQGTITIEAHYL